MGRKKNNKNEILYNQGTSLVFFSKDNVIVRHTLLPHAGTTNTFSKEVYIYIHIYCHYLTGI